MSDTTTTTEFEKYTTEEIAKMKLDLTILRSELTSDAHRKTRIKVWAHIGILVIGTVLASLILHDLAGVVLGTAPAGAIEIFDRLAKII